MAAGSAAGQTPNASHPGNDYYVQPSLGVIQRQDNPVAAGLLQAAGYQGPMTWDQAQTVLSLNKKAVQGGKVPITGTAGEAATGQTGSLPNPLAGIAGSMEAFFSVITDGKMWRSLGWIILGLFLVITGVQMWLAPGAARTLLAARTGGALLCRPPCRCPAGT